MRSIVVAGASLAGLRAAEELRSQGFDGTITVIGDEPHLPYDRPPLSKQVLAGSWDLDRIALTVGGDGGLDSLDLEWRLGLRVVGLDVASRVVELSDGERLPFGGVVIATGASPRMLPSCEPMPGVHTLRTLDDCLTLRAELDGGPQRVVVVGAGFIGAEVAATCRERGLEVSLIEALPVPMERAIGAEVGVLMADIHRDHGVDVRLGVGVDGFGGDTRVEKVHLADGTVLPADVVVVGIGVAPNTGWLEGSGLSLGNGVQCDATSLAAPGVVAAGDVACWESARFGRRVRVEHWDNAISMGEHAARRLLADAVGGEVEPYDPVPWFWSDQYDRKIQLAGLALDAEEMVVVDGSFDERRFAAIYRQGDRIVGVLAMNRPRQVVRYRALIERGATWSEALAL